MKRALQLMLVLLFPVFLKAETKRIKTSDGTELFVEVKGKGQPCLYIHGGPGAGAYWLQYFSGEMLEKYFTMVYVDQRGVSRSSSAPSGDYSLKRVSLDFEEIRQQLGYKNWLVMTHSFGGVMGVDYASQYPQSVKGMLMINSTVGLPDCAENIIREGLKRKVIDDSPALHDTTLSLWQRVGPVMGTFKKKDEFWKLYYHDKKNDLMMDSVISTVPNWNYDFGRNFSKYKEYEGDLSSFTANITCPVLFFAGTRDYAIGPDHYRLAKFPNQMLIRYEGGHVPFIEHKTELEEAIQKYLSKYN